MRRTTGLAALCLLSTLWLAGCGTSSNLNAPVASPTPFTPKVTGEVAVPTAGSIPTAIARAFDGNLWFTEQATNKVAKIAVGSTVTITEPVQLAAGSAPTSIAPGPDTNLWVVETGADKIAKVSPTNGLLVAEYALTAGARPQQIVAGPDNNMWFTEAGSGSTPNRIGTISPSTGIVTEYNLPTGGVFPYSIAPGPDGALWFTERNASRIGRITTGGAVTAEMATQTPNAQPFQIAPAPDNAMWFTEQATGRLGRVALAGAPTDIALPGVSSVAGFSIGSDTNFYIADPTANAIAQVNPFGTLAIKEFAIPTPSAFSTANSFPGMLAIGFDAKVYFVENNANKVGQFSYF